MLGEQLPYLNILLSISYIYGFTSNWDENAVFEYLCFVLKLVIRGKVNRDHRKHLGPSYIETKFNCYLKK